MGESKSAKAIFVENCSTRHLTAKRVKKEEQEVFDFYALLVHDHNKEIKKLNFDDHLLHWSI